MKFCRFDGDRQGLVSDDGVYDITTIVENVLSQRPLSRWGDPMIASLDQISAALQDADLGSPMPLASVSFLSPTAHPSKLIGAPTNYHSLVAEMEKIEPGRSKGRSVADSGLFLKANSAMVGTGEGVHIRFPERATEFEAEFVIVIGKEGSQISEADALDHVAGYCMGLDMTVRGKEERSIRKSIDSYAVLGPWLATKDEVLDPNDFGYKLFVNGSLRQDERTSDMIFNCQQLIAIASEFYTLYPGDVIFTGAGAGAGPVKPGDTMTGECGPLGPFEVKCHAYVNPRR